MRSDWLVIIIMVNACRWRQSSVRALGGGMSHICSSKVIHGTLFDVMKNDNYIVAFWQTNMFYIIMAKHVQHEIKTVYKLGMFIL